MDSITYLMATKQVSNLRNLERTSNNIANANTTGFKEDRMAFDQYLVKDKDKDKKTAYGTDIYSYTNQSQGALNTTFRQLDVAIEGNGFFEIITPEGPMYTRNGNFHLDPEKRLVTSQGYVVGGDIVFDENDIDIMINDDGTISANGNQRGQLVLVEFENPKALEKIGNGLFKSTQNALAAENSSVVQGVLEDSNVNSVTQISTLIELNRETGITTNLLNDNFNLQRSAFKAYSKLNGGG